MSPGAGLPPPPSFVRVRASAHDYLVAVVMATEVPATALTRDGKTFTAAMIEPALRCVASVIMTRARSSDFPSTPVAVVMQKNQFSAVCREDYWRRALYGDWQPAHVERALRVWSEMASGASPLPLDATHYYSPISMVPPYRVPGWARNLEEIAVPEIQPDFFRWFR